MTDYYIESATKEEWAERAIKAEKRSISSILYTEFADELLILKLEDQMADAFKDLALLSSKTEDSSTYWTEYTEHITLIRACLTLLSWYTTNDYYEENLQVNKYSLKLQELF